MFGTWQLTRVASSPTESSPSARDSRTHRRFGSPRARATAAERWRSILGGGLDVDHVRQSLTGCANTQVEFAAGPGRVYSRACSDRRPSPSARSARPARRCSRGRVHHTPMLSSATAARVAATAAGARLGDDRLYLKAEHLQKTGSFKPRAALARIAVADRRRARAAGAITISAGNAGQAYAWAGREAGVPVTVVMPAAAVALEGRGLPASTAPRSSSTARTSASRSPQLEELRRGARA